MTTYSPHLSVTIFSSVVQSPFHLPSDRSFAPKIPHHMDLHDWEFLTDDSCHDLTDNHHKRISQEKRISDSKNSLDFDYILCPSLNARKITQPDQVDPVPIPSEPKIVKAVEDETVKGIRKKPDEVNAERHAASQVSFQTKENKFVDSTVINPVNTDALKFETELPDRNKEEDKNSGSNIWKWSFTGIGAICTFGVAAATICVLFLGTQQKNKPHHNQKNVFKFYTDDKKMKQVMEHATKLNEAISVSARGGPTPLARAHITYGAYTDGLLSID